MTIWRPDVLPGFEATTLALTRAELAPTEPADTELVATVVRKSAGRTKHLDEGPRRAVLYVHGWNDYFFQPHLAEFWQQEGFDFYALDLRRYGRSLRPGQLFGFIADLDDYADELNAAVDLVCADHDQLILSGHSTGGLIAALWAADRPGRVHAMILNSPWLDLQGSAMVRTLGTPVIEALGASLATSVIRLPETGNYRRSLHLSHGGEWDYDLAWKSSPAAVVRVGWLRAVLQGHQRVAAGLGIEFPVLVMCSATSDFRRRWAEEMRRADTVLDVEQIAARAGKLGRHVTIVRFEGGLHDLVLSAPDVRERVFAEMHHWTEAYLTGSVGLPTK